MFSKLHAKRKARKDRYQADALSSSASATAQSAADESLNEGLHFLFPIS